MEIVIKHPLAPPFVVRFTARPERLASNLITDALKTAEAARISPKLNMDRRRQARAGEAAAAVARITTNLWVIERILNDARLGRFDDLRYPEQ